MKDSCQLFGLALNTTLYNYHHIYLFIYSFILICNLALTRLYTYITPNRNKAHTNININKLEKGVEKAKIERANKILEKHFGKTNNICSVVDAIYALGQTFEKREGLKWNKKRKEKKNQERPNRRIRKLEKLTK